MTTGQAVAIPCFNRPDALETVLNSLPLSRLSHVYIGVDGPTTRYRRERDSCLATASDFAQSQQSFVTVIDHNRNRGAASNVLSITDLMLRHHQEGVVLEDDCVPTSEFFQFVHDAMKHYENDPRVLLACGSQFAPSELVNGSHVLSRYPLVWGWGTTTLKWQRILEALESSLKSSGSSTDRWRHRLSPVESFWRSGHRRAVEGRTDAWDTPLVYAMGLHKYLAVLPKTAMISNIGDDERATHTAGAQPWTRASTKAVTFDDLAGDGTAVDHWLEKYLYQVHPRHVITTRCRRIIDRIDNNRVRPPLRERLPSISPDPTQDSMRSEKPCE